MDCSDGKTCLCFPILCAWIADHAEHATLHAKKASEYERTGTPSIAKYFQQIGLKIGRNVFSGLYLVDSADLHKLDLLHNIYLGLFKHMMEWVEGFVKKQKRQQALDDVWKTLPPYPGFSVLKKAYREVTQ